MYMPQTRRGRKQGMKRSHPSEKYAPDQILSYTTVGMLLIAEPHSVMYRIPEDPRIMKSLLILGLFFKLLLDH